MVSQCPIRWVRVNITLSVPTWKANQEGGHLPYSAFLRQGPFLQERLHLSHHHLSVRGVGESVHWSGERFQVFVLLQWEKTR